MNRYLFNIKISGLGKNADAAWEDATEQFALDPGPTPEKDEYTKEPFDEEE